jgi:hypothetical protein
MDITTTTRHRLSLEFAELQELRDELQITLGELNTARSQLGLPGYPLPMLRRLAALIDAVLSDPATDSPPDDSAPAAARPPHPDAVFNCPNGPDCSICCRQGETDRFRAAVVAPPVKLQRANRPAQVVPEYLQPPVQLVSSPGDDSA